MLTPSLWKVLRQCFFYAAVAVAIIGLLNIWRVYQTKLHIQKTLGLLRPYQKIEQVIAAMGQPYAIYENIAPKLGSSLVGPADDENVVFYAFVLEKLPPLFVVVKVDKKQGTVLAIGAEKS